jgi:hypothetical protein
MDKNENTTLMPRTISSTAPDIISPMGILFFARVSLEPK